MRSLSERWDLSNEKFGLSRGNTRFFGTLDLRSEIIPGVSLSVGVRNSIDKTFPFGFCAEHRVFVCDNLAFRSELLVTRRHTVNGQARFQEAIALAVKALGEFRESEAVRIGQMQLQMIEDMLAESLILRAYEQGIVSYKVLPAVIKAWRFSPPEFEARNLWSLLNAFTLAMKPRADSNPQQFALQTIRLHALLEPTPALRLLEPPKD
jgi:hypothetical protein